MFKIWFINKQYVQIYFKTIEIRFINKQYVQI